MPELNEYTIFLDTDPQTRAAFSSAIESCAREAGTSVFAPHVTLLSGIHGGEEELMRKWEELASRVSPFKIPLLSLQTGEQFYKSLFIECEATPQLTSLNEKAKKIFGGSAPYLPHLSLLYGEVPSETKDYLVKNLSALALPTLYPALGLSLWHAKGEVEEWRVVAEAAFK